MSATPHLDAASAMGRAFLGTRHAIMAGAMTWVSERQLVSAISNAGGFGVLACGAMPPALLAAEIAATKALTDQPFGVNLITLHPQLDELIQVCASAGVTHVVLAGGLPSGPAIAAIKAFGAKLMCFAPTAALAKKLVRSGVDAIIIEGSEAGGHIGPVSTTVLAQEILPVVRDVPVFVAGGIGRGSAMAAFLDMGASGVQLGTRFAAASESVAHDKFKAAFVRASARDAIASVQVDPRLPVIPVRALKNASTEAFMARQREVAAQVDAGELDLAAGQLAIEHYWAGALRRAVVEGDVDTGSLMAGQSVGMVTKVEPVATIIADLVAEAEASLQRAAA
jgi:enoyl-[acyl-carrier protein] reductase II